MVIESAKTKDPAPFGGAELELCCMLQDNFPPPNGAGSLLSQSINISLLRSEGKTI
jgi:hypothetical protein